MENGLNNTAINNSLRLVLRIKTEDLENGELSLAKKEAKRNIESAGLVISEDRQESEQGYVTVENPSTGKKLVISKTYDNKSTLFGDGVAINPEESINHVLRTVDMYGYLTKETVEKPKTARFINKVSQVEALNRDLEHYRRIWKDYIEDMEHIRERIDYYEQLMSDTQKEMIDLIQNSQQ